MHESGTSALSGHPARKNNSPENGTLNLDAVPAAGFLLAQSARNLGFRAREQQMAFAPVPAGARSLPGAEESAALKEHQIKEEQAYAAILQGASEVTPLASLPDAGAGPPFAPLRDADALHRLMDRLIFFTSGGRPLLPDGAEPRRSFTDGGISWITLRDCNELDVREGDKAVPETILNHKDGRLGLRDRKMKRDKTKDEPSEQDTGRAAKLMRRLVRLALAASIVALAILAATGKGCSL